MDNKIKIIFLISVLFISTQRLYSQTQTDTIATIVFAGDLTFARHYQNAISHNTNIFKYWNVDDYDLMMVNLENAVTESIDSVQKEFVFKMQKEYLQILLNGKIKIVNCANNHTADFGTEGLLETIHNLDSIEIKHVGVGKNIYDARKPVIININGISVGFLGYGGVKNFIAERSKPGTAARISSYICKDVELLKKQVDFVVVNLHWGKELELMPDSSQIDLAHKIIDYGADIIIGHHPHVLQGIERYKNKIIAYSLGNFIFGGNYKAANSNTAVLKIIFSKNYYDVNILPVTIKNWFPYIADSIISKNIINKIKERSNVFKSTIFNIQGE